MAAATKKSPGANGTTTPAEVSGILIEMPQMNEIVVEIEGTTPLLVCAWSIKARRQMLGKQMKEAKTAREAKDPKQCYLDSLYVSTDGWTGIPANGFKDCL